MLSIRATGKGKGYCGMDMRPLGRRSASPKTRERIVLVGTALVVPAAALFGLGFPLYPGSVLAPVLKAQAALFGSRDSSGIVSLVAASESGGFDEGRDSRGRHVPTAATR